MSTPWKTVQTRRTRARGRPPELTQRGRNTTLDSFSLKQTRGQAALDHTQWERTNTADAVLGQPYKPTKGTPSGHSDVVATQSEPALMLQPREDERQAMQGSGKAGYPTNAPTPCDVAVEDVQSPCMVMQHEHDFRPTS